MIGILRAFNNSCCYSVGNVYNADNSDRARRIDGMVAWCADRRGRPVNAVRAAPRDSGSAGGPGEVGQDALMARRTVSGGVTSAGHLPGLDMKTGVGVP